MEGVRRRLGRARAWSGGRGPRRKTRGGESPQGTAFTTRTGSYGNQSGSIERSIDRSGFYRRDRRTHHLHEETARLADPAGGAEDGDLVPARLGHRAGDGAGRARGAEEGGHGEEDVRLRVGSTLFVGADGKGPPAAGVCCDPSRFRREREREIEISRRVDRSRSRGRRPRTFFTRRPVSRFDRAPFQPTDERTAARRRLQSRVLSKAQAPRLESSSEPRTTIDDV
jgi:hypothetical protein